ncbi:MAG TPA: PilZ domain-containing protein [Vicinamibacteria bacterium]
MTAVLICSAVSLDAALRLTCLWREDIARHYASGAEEARAQVHTARPRLVVVDRDLPGALALVKALRHDASTRQLSMVVVVRGQFAPAEVDLLEAGANAILRLPATPEWDERLTRLLQVPVRREGRFAARFSVHAYAGLAGGSGQAVALNLSVNGVLLECPFPLAVGDALSLELDLSESGPTVAASGQVVREARAGRFGIDFRRLDREAADQIRRVVESGRA